MEVNAANVTLNKFFCTKPSFVNKKLDEKADSVICLKEEIQEIIDNAILVMTKKATCIGWDDGTYQLHFP